MDINIRPAKKKDMAAVFDMIKEFAEFQKMSHILRINEQTLIKNGFSNSPTFICYVAECRHSHMIGYALYCYRFCTFREKCVFLRDLYVKSEYRKQGVGNQLLLEVAKIAYQTSGKKLDVYVSAANPAIEFYEKIGAEDMTKTEDYHLLQLKDCALNKLYN